MDGEISWYRATIKETFSLLETGKEGIDKEEASLRLSRYGYNEIEKKKKHGPVYLFLKQFANPLIYVLIAAAIVTFILNEYADSAVITGVVFANALIGFIQERKAENALESLTKMMEPEATILRDGMREIIPSKEVVVGDVVIIEAGSRVPADLRLFRTKNLRIDESALTGESIAVEKNIETVEDEDVPLGDQTNMAFSSTLITQGKGMGIVVATGVDTEIGKISELIQETEKFSTPLTRTVDKFGKKLFIVIVFISALTYIAGRLQGFETLDIFLATISMAVAAIPEGLPALITISLAIGVNTMASRNAIIRNLPSVETLGSATVICSDKTGTLTMNQMVVTSIYTTEGVFKVGDGQSKESDFLKEGKKVDAQGYPSLVSTLKAGALCNNAYVREHDGIAGEPTESALLASAIKVSSFHLPRLDEIPFESENRYMATLHEENENSNIIYVKGSPEKITEMCQGQYNGTDVTDLENDKILETASNMASEGLRVIAMACKHVDKSKNELEPEDIDKLIFLGLQGMMDPPREEVKDAIKKCSNAGIRVIMITGDHVLTANSIADQLGIKTEGALSGSDLEQMSDEKLREKLNTVSVFARTSPEDKSRIVGLLKEQRDIVAVTGDGINDAPALKKADIGIAMGKSGTEVAKEASDMVLTDDNFASIVNAIEEGRDVYNKIQKVILWTLPTNAAEGLAIIAAVLLGITNPPLMPLHILWINTVTAIGLGVPIVFEPKEKHLLMRSPRSPDEPLLLPIIKRRIVIVALLMVTASFLLFFEIGNASSNIAKAQTIVLNTIVFFEIFYLFTSKSIYENVAGRLFSNRIMLGGIVTVILLQLFITYNSLMNSILDTAPLEFLDWIFIILVSSTVFFVIEAEKVIHRKHRKTK